MDSVSDVPLCSEVKVGEPTMYLLRMDNHETRKGRATGELCYVASGEIASQALEALANAEIKALSSPDVRITRENKADPSPYIKRIDIYKEQKGYVYNSGPRLVCSLGYVQVCCATYTNPLLMEENDEEYDE
jgi:hypothetical protein